ncbi:MAG TPA: hypothetical protein VGE15_11375, partial [Sphingobacteriaceae bacterium]
MKKLLTLAVFFTVLGATSVSGQTWRDDDRRYADNTTYRDDRGDYHWKVVERRVWIPERRVRGLFGSRVIPGHYEIRRDRVKVYHRSKHYPYGQAKKKWDRGRDKHDRRDRDRCN